jgi:hypothetical protein
MPSATLNLRVSPRRMLTAREASDYTGVSAAQLPVRPVELPNGKRLYDLHDLDAFLDGLKGDMAADDEAIIARLG